MTAPAPLDVFVIAGEESGDNLAAPLMRELATRPGGATFRGVGGDRMRRQGLVSLFPMDDITAMGLGAVIGKLPTITRRLSETVEAVLADPPDVLVLVDAPDFTHRVASRVRRRNPAIPIVKYVAPTVWAWRPGRARAMHGWIDHVLALLPFEPEVMARLGGPPTSYVGHPLLSELPDLRPSPEELARREAERPMILALPGSRRSEIRRLGPIFGEALFLLAEAGHQFELVLPTLPRLLPVVEQSVANWPVRPRIVTDPAAKLAAFRSARAALAASGTVTLELALANVPMVGAYRIATWEAALALFVLKTRTVLLANIALGETVVPELIQLDCRPDRLADAMETVLLPGPVRDRQFEGFRRLEELLATGGEPAARIAADIVETVVREKGTPPRQIAASPRAVS